LASLATSRIVGVLRLARLVLEAIEFLFLI